MSARLRFLSSLLDTLCVKSPARPGAAGTFRLLSAAPGLDPKCFSPRAYTVSVCADSRYLRDNEKIQPTAGKQAQVICWLFFSTLKVQCVRCRGDLLA